jgi:hypothetical protein
MDLHFDLGFDFIVGRDGFVIDVKVEGFAFKDTDGRNSYSLISPTRSFKSSWTIFNSPHACWNP